MNSEELGWSCPVALEWQDGIATGLFCKNFLRRNGFGIGFFLNFFQ